MKYLTVLIYGRKKFYNSGEQVEKNINKKKLFI